MSSEPFETIALAGNVFVPAILALRAGGYVVSRVAVLETEQWLAIRPDRRLVADDPVQLLGLAAIRDARGVAWSANDAEIEAAFKEFGLG